MIKSTGCFSKGPVNSQHPHGSSQTFVMPFPRDLTPSVASLDTAQMGCTDRHSGKPSYTYNNKTSNNVIGF